MIDIAQIDPAKLHELSADQLRQLTRELLARAERDGREIGWRDAKIDKLTFEIAQLKRMKFDRSSEQLSAEQRALFDEAVDGDIAAIDEQLAALQAAYFSDRGRPLRADRGRRIGVAVAALGRRAGTGLTVA